jgi:hypothetical protein
VRVNITYSIDFDEVLEEMEELLQKLKNKSVAQFNQGFEDLLTNLEIGDEEVALQLIPEIREEMIIIDRRLGECFNILEGYKNILAEKEKESSDE